MTEIAVVLKYPGAANLWRVWAESEAKIDFRKDRFKADRCTSAFSLVELKYFLEKADCDLSLVIQEERPKASPFIELSIREEDSGGGFELRPEADGIIIEGDGRNGLLNGAYELLREQGWRWLEPGPYGESAPQNPTLDFLHVRKSCVPSFRYRMIDQYRESDDSVQLLLWQARNRINVVFRKAASGKFADKLGMLSRRGGHLLQKLMKADQLLPDGQTLFAAHPEWYGLPEEGGRKLETATRTQLCMSQEGLLQYLSEKILQLLQGEMAEIDMIDLWGFDTWGRNCHCEGCKGLGNGADQNLYLLSRLREYLNVNLQRKVMMNTISYEGSVTMEAPTKAVPGNLVEAGDFVIFYPIRRCYRHLLADQTCSLNKPYRESLQGWHEKASGLSLWAGEYYNVSKYEDLPLVFSKLIPAELRYYHAYGCNGATYMHSLSPNWGVRSLTQLQHTQYAWDINTSDELFLDEYFTRKYDNHAENMRRIYRSIEDAFADIASWRNWGIGALDVLMPWDGKQPEKEFSLPHFPKVSEAFSALEKSVKKLETAMQDIRICLQTEQENNWRYLPAPVDIPALLTPLDFEKIRFYDKMEYRLGEDLRGLVYGLDTISLLQAVVQYHDDLFRGNDGENTWHQIERLAAKMSDYYIPITYENPTPGIMIKDALTRTQLRMLITRCRGARIKRRIDEKTTV